MNIEENLGFVPIHQTEHEPVDSGEVARQEFEQQLVVARDIFFNRPDQAPASLGIRDGDIPISQKSERLASAVRNQEVRLRAMSNPRYTGSFFEPSQDPSKLSHMDYWGRYISSHEGASQPMQTVENNQEWRLFVTIQRSQNRN